MTRADLAGCRIALEQIIDIVDDSKKPYEERAYVSGALANAIECARAELGQDRSAGEAIECHGLDTRARVCFYEQDFYVLSNFSAFRVGFGSRTFDTSEAAYHYQKFLGDSSELLFIRDKILGAESAHEAFKIAEANKKFRRSDWDDVKLDVMRRVLRAKVDQHEYVRRKLLATGDRELVENSWRDPYWGWGPNRDGENMLGKLWMELRAELRARGPA